MQNEIFKDIKGYEGLYQISNFGMVKSLGRNVRRKNGYLPVKEKILKLTIHHGYPQITLHNKIFKIHQLVAYAFLPPPYGKVGKSKYDYQVNHKNGIKYDNRVENLEWITRSENMLHSFRIGLRNHKGENNSNAKLNNRQVKVIKHCLKTGMKYSDLTKCFNATYNMIHDVAIEKTWKHIKI